MAVGRRFFVYFAVAAGAFAQAEDAKSAISAMLRPFASREPYRGEFITTYVSLDPNVTGAGPVETHRRIVRFGGPGKYITEEQTPCPWVNYVADGVRWVFAPDILQYMEMPANGGSIPAETASLTRLAAMSAEQASFLPGETLEIEGRQIPCSVVQADFEDRHTGPAGRVTFYVDDSRFLRRVITVGAKQIVTMTILALEREPHFSDADFRFVPPAQAARVNNIVRTSSQR